MDSWHWGKRLRHTLRHDEACGGVASVDLPGLQMLHNNWQSKEGQGGTPMTCHGTHTHVLLQCPHPFQASPSLLYHRVNSAQTVYLAIMIPVDTMPTFPVLHKFAHVTVCYQIFFKAHDGMHGVADVASTWQALLLSGKRSSDIARFASTWQAPLPQRLLVYWCDRACTRPFGGTSGC